MCVTLSITLCYMSERLCLGHSKFHQRWSVICCLCTLPPPPPPSFYQSSPWAKCVCPRPSRRPYPPGCEYVSTLLCKLWYHPLSCVPMLHQLWGLPFGIKSICCSEMQDLTNAGMRSPVNIRTSRALCTSVASTHLLKACVTQESRKMEGWGARPIGWLDEELLGCMKEKFLW